MDRSFERSIDYCGVFGSFLLPQVVVVVLDEKITTESLQYWNVVLVDRDAYLL